MNIRIASTFAGFVSACFLALLLGIMRPAPAFAAFGLTNSGGYYTVDSGAGLVFKVDQANGDIPSIKYNGVEINGQTKRSHISSGLGNATVSATTYGTSVIKISASTATLTHYFMVRNGINNIYMATFVTAEPTVGELRWITRLNATRVPNGPIASDLDGNTGAIESSDVFGLAHGQTRSKYFGRDRAIDLSIGGATGSGVGVFMHYGNRESSSGGPFFRDIQNQQGGDQEVYNYMNSGHEQTEANRLGVLHGPYALIFTNGSTPSASLDTSWIDTQALNLSGWVRDRGLVQGTATGIPSGFQGVVGFANTMAQSWCFIDPTTGAFSSPLLKPGDYLMTLYKGELSVATTNISVAASTVPVVQNMASAETNPAHLWRIGEWDGTPAGFLNAANIPNMHPSDVRQKSWGPVTYTVGTSTPDAFPSCQWKDVNNPTTIKFNLAANQLLAATVRVGLTCAYVGGRPVVKVNSWTSPNPSASSQPDSRSLTVGTYRGNNVTYTYNVPASALVAGTNTMTLTVISGSGLTGFLSAGYAYDCVEFDSLAPTPTPLRPRHQFRPQPLRQFQRRHQFQRSHRFRLPQPRQFQPKHQFRPRRRHLNRQLRQNQPRHPKPLRRPNQLRPRHPKPLRRPNQLRPRRPKPPPRLSRLPRRCLKPRRRQFQRRRPLPNRRRLFFLALR